MKTPNYLHPPPTPSLTYSVGCWELQTLTSQYKSLYLQFFCVGALTRGDGTTIFSSPTFLALLQASSQVVEQIEVLLKEDSWEVKTSSFLPSPDGITLTSMHGHRDGSRNHPVYLSFGYGFSFTEQTRVDPMLRSPRCTGKHSLKIVLKMLRDLLHSFIHPTKRSVCSS